MAVLNLGGIANLSLLVSESLLKADSDPPILCRYMAPVTSGCAFDYEGNYAASGCVNDDLLTPQRSILRTIATKSTGREYFSSAWLLAIVNQFPFIEPTDVQATLNRLTAVLVDRALSSDIDILVVCGGGIHNAT